MQTEFYKYHGAGNDFIIIDDREEKIFPSTLNAVKDISLLCNRRFGIGADGLMLLRTHSDYDFQMIYFNSDGRESTMCGNGGRCLAAFASYKEFVQSRMYFIAADGPHHAEVFDGENGKNIVSLQMKNVAGVRKMSDGYFLDTGSPHFILFVDDIDSVDVYNEGKKWRHDPLFGPGGTNVNFVSIKNNTLNIRTFERGVEDETFACGTGITAAAIASYSRGYVLNRQLIAVKAMGGDLSVSFKEENDGSFSDIYLTGPTVRVFKGTIEI
jgi:diaminopimelate epimerase